MICISEAPFDVIESILKEVDTRDLQSVIKSFPVFQKVSSKSKVLWIIHAQKLLSRHRYLDLPTADSLKDYTIHQLRVAICKAVNLELSWVNENPRYHSISEECEFTEDFHEPIDKIWKLSYDRILYHSSSGHIRVFDIRAKAVITKTLYRDGVRIRDCTVVYSNNTSHIYCLYGKSVYTADFPFVTSRGEEEPDEPLWNYSLIRIDVPDRSMRMRKGNENSTKIHELTKFRCPGKFKYGTIAKIDEGFIAIITECRDINDNYNYGKYYINILQDYKTGDVCSLVIDPERQDRSATIALSLMDDKFIFYEILPNEKRVASIAFQDKETKTFGISIGELQTEEVYKWNPSSDGFEPIGEEFSCLQSFQSIQYQCFGSSENYVSTAYILQVSTSEDDDRGYGIYFYNSLLLIQHYSSFGQRHRSSPRCVINITRAYNDYDYDEGEDIPVVDVTFNHAAWIVRNGRSKKHEVKLATFPQPNYDGEDSGDITEAHIVTLDIPDSLTESMVHKSVNEVIDKVIIDEVQGAVILCCFLNRFFTLYYG